MSASDTPPLSPAYLAAIAAHDAACLVYRAASDAYRMRKIGDAEFIAAKVALTTAHAVFDAAYAAEAKTSEGAVR
jgi:hypothetical protein